MTRGLTKIIFCDIFIIPRLAWMRWPSSGQRRSKMTSGRYGYWGVVIRDGREDRVELEDVAAANAFIVEYRAADRVCITRGTSEGAHTLFTMEKGCITLAPRWDSMYPIGTPELLAAHERKRERNRISFDACCDDCCVNDDGDIDYGGDGDI